jgi:hypothetical protein
MRPRRQGSGMAWRQCAQSYVLTLAQQWLDIAEIGDAADQERDLRDECS